MCQADIELHGKTVVTESNFPLILLAHGIFSINGKLLLEQFGSGSFLGDNAVSKAGSSPVVLYSKIKEVSGQANTVLTNYMSRQVAI